jgi:hypothetical protein
VFLPSDAAGLMGAVGSLRELLKNGVSGAPAPVTDGSPKALKP